VGAALLKPRPGAFDSGFERYGEGVFFRPAHIQEQMVRTAPRGVKWVQGRP
jgi:hypothetical protein